MRRILRNIFSSERVIDVEGFEYRVQNTGNIFADIRTAKALHELNTLAIQIISATQGRYDWYDNLAERYTVDKVIESSASGDDTSYVLDLGKEIHLCVRDEEKVVLLTVLTHELAHIANDTIHHDTKFWEIYGKLREVVRELGLINIRDVPVGGGLHCGKVKISRDELKSLAFEDPIHKRVAPFRNVPVARDAFYEKESLHGVRFIPE